ncbi:MAG TPA: TlpA family protein disulfide reductase [Polyangiaceae bacterium]
MSRFAGLVGLWLVGCQAVPVTPAVEAPPTGRVLSFAFGTIDGAELSSATTRGRVTALLFVTTFDLASQMEAKRLNVLYHSHRPRFNAGVIVLEAPEYAVLAGVFRSSLGLSFPVALADNQTQEGQSPLGVQSVPTLLVLDRDGRELARRSGLLSEGEMDRLLSLKASGSGHSSD